MAFNYQRIATGSFGRTDPTITVKAWNDATNIYQDILNAIGGWQNNSNNYIVPLSFANVAFPNGQADSLSGNFAGLYCTGVNIVGEHGNDKNNTGYWYFDCDLTFGTLKEYIGNDNTQGYVITAELSSNSLSLPTSAGTLKWAGSGEPLTGEDITPTLWQPYMSIHCAAPWRQDGHADTLSDYCSNVNSSSVSIGGRSFAAGELLFQGASLEPATSVDGSKGWTRVLTFAQRETNWNYLYNCANNDFEAVSPAIYDTSDLNDVLTL